MLDDTDFIHTNKNNLYSEEKVNQIKLLKEFINKWFTITKEDDVQKYMKCYLSFLNYVYFAYIILFFICCIAHAFFLNKRYLFFLIPSIILFIIFNIIIVHSLYCGFLELSFFLFYYILFIYLFYDASFFNYIMCFNYTILFVLLYKR
jgi:hypothetical protein